ncbi:hypothetical protein VN97_g12399 [Penicillium thymicola]|uniref:Uncharacterized protein n=1 Tax=Penicillium thymicola TaxID=293382 RepID=A0AAI9T625_PENTH|nr:hypothetical protein VN97_g12399 [Penicillium thymicola]
MASLGGYDGLCYGNSGIHIFCRQIFRQIQAPILPILVSDPWPGYTTFTLPPPLRYAACQEEETRNSLPLCKCRK